MVRGPHPTYIKLYKFLQVCYLIFIFVTIVIRGCTSVLLANEPKLSLDSLGLYLLAACPFDHHMLAIHALDLLACTMAISS